MRNAIIITNLINLSTGVEIQNFSDENVKEAISKILKVDVDNLQCQVANTSYSIYSTKEITPSVIENTIPIEGYNDSQVLNPIYVKYIQLI